MPYKPHAFDVKHIDIKLFHAVENNAVDYVIGLLEDGADPHALIPVSMSQFRSSFRGSRLTHLTATFRALQLYHDDMLLSRLAAGNTMFRRVPPAYAFVSEMQDDFHGDRVEIDGKSVVVSDLLVAMSTMEKVAAQNRSLIADSIGQRLSALGASSLYAAGDVACDHVARFLAQGNARELELALALFDTGAQIRGDDDGWQALSRMRGIARQRNRGTRTEASLPIAAMYITQQPHADIGARLMKLLLKNHAVDPNFRERGLSLLHWAAFLDDAGSIHHLLEHGADAHALSDADSDAAAEPATADEIAELCGNETSAKVIRAYNARHRVQSVIDLVRQRMAAIPRQPAHPLTAAVL